MRRIDKCGCALALLMAFGTTASALAAETGEGTRGLRIVARDSVDRDQAEAVPLYRKTFAVIIGIDSYPKLARDRQLQYAVRDAKGVESAIRRNFRFDSVFTLFNEQATRQGILSLLTDELPAQMTSDDAVFVFFAGHGDQIERPGGEIGYLLPYDGEVGKVSTGISMTELSDTVSKSLPAKHVFYVIDACYGGIMATRAVDRAPRRDLAYIKDITRERVRQVLTAGGKKQEVLDGGPNGHSVFTGRFIEILERSTEFVTANEIQAIVKEKVFGDAQARNHNQTPAFATLNGSGDFVFVPNSQVKTEVTARDIARLEELDRDIDRKISEARAVKDRVQQERAVREAEHRKAVNLARLELERKRLAEIDQAARDAEQRRLEVERAERAMVENQRALEVIKAERERQRSEKEKLLKQIAQDAEGRPKDLAAAVAQIKALRGQIAETEARYGEEKARAVKQIEARHRERQEQLAREKRDEFEKESEFSARQAKEAREARAAYEKAIADLSHDRMAAVETAPLKKQIERIAAIEFDLPSDEVGLTVEPYESEHQRFKVRVSSRGLFPTVRFETGGWLGLRTDVAKAFRKQLDVGLVRALATARADERGEGLHLASVSIVNDTDEKTRTLYRGHFITPGERSARLWFEDFRLIDPPLKDERPVGIPIVVKNTGSGWKVAQEAKPSDVYGDKSLEVFYVDYPNRTIQVGALNRKRTCANISGRDARNADSYDLCNSYFGNTDVGGSVRDNVIYGVLSLGLLPVLGGGMYSVTYDPSRVEAVLRDSDAISYGQVRTGYSRVAAERARPAEAAPVAPDQAAAAAATATGSTLPAEAFKALVGNPELAIPGSARAYVEGMLPAIREMAIAQGQEGVSPKLAAAQEMSRKLPAVARGNRKEARAANKAGLERMQGGQHEQAAAEFFRGLTLDATDVEIANNLGFALVKASRYKEARQFTLMAIALVPGRVGAWMNLGEALAGLGDAAGTMAAFSTAYELSQDKAKTAAYLVKLGDNEKAHPLARRTAQELVARRPPPEAPQAAQAL